MLFVGGMPPSSSTPAYEIYAPWTGADQTFTDAQVLDSAGEGVSTGSMTVTDTSTGSIGIASNVFTITGSGSATTTGVVSTAAYPRVLGAVGMITLSDEFTGAASNYSGVGWDITAGVSSTKTDGIVSNDASTTLLSAHSGSWRLSTAKADGDKYAGVLGGFNSAKESYNSGDTAANFNYGSHIYIKQGATWRLLSAGYTAATAPDVYFEIARRTTSAATLDDLKI